MEKKTVIIIEDGLSLARAISCWITEVFKHNAVIFDDIWEAYSYIQDNKPFDIVLIDFALNREGEIPWFETGSEMLRLKDVEGEKNHTIEFVRYLTINHKEIPIILMSGYYNEYDFCKTALIETINKSAGFERLIKVVEKHL